MPIYSDEARGLIHGPFRKHMGRPEDRTPLGSSVGLGSFGDVLRLRETQAMADGREADYSEAEAQRRSAEVLRGMAEEGRQEAETARETAESGREDAESARVAAETSRDNAETARASAESARITAESDRQTAEAGRVQAELDRQANRITSANVSVDDNVGVPSATVTLGTPSPDGRSISFDFRNLKGDPVNLVPITDAQIDTIAGDGTVTNDNVLTGTGLTYLWGWIKSKFASLVSGAVQIVQGGTGATTASGARNSLGVPTASSIASAESVTATRNHAIGDYFMLGDVLMKATAAIATGETINASNATPATVQSQIDTLQNSVGETNDLKFEVKTRNYGNVSPDDALDDIIADMASSSKCKLEVGIFYANGYHAYIAHRYPSANPYGAVLSFDPWGMMRLGRLDNGVFSMTHQAIRIADVSATTGTTQYNGQYYGDVNLPIPLERFIALSIIYSADNRLATAQVISSQSRIRVYSPMASTQVTIRVVYVV